MQRFRRRASPRSRRCARWASCGIATSPPPRARRRAWAGRSRASLRAHGVDFSFTPVLDLDYGASAVIGDRAFHRNPNAVAHLGCALLAAACAPAAWPPSASTFPGTASSPPTRTSTCRSTSAACARAAGGRPRAVRRADQAGLEAIMPAHVVYPAIDPHPGRLLAVLAAGRPAPAARLRRHGLLGRPRHGRRAGRGRHGRARRGRLRGRLRHGAGVQRRAAAATLLERWRPPPSPDLARRAAAMAGRASARVAAECRRSFATRGYAGESTADPTP